MRDLEEIRPHRLPYSKVLKDDQKKLLELEQDTAVNLYLFKKDAEDFADESPPDDLVSTVKIQKVERPVHQMPREEST
jgi:hypothetical protein